MSTVTQRMLTRVRRRGGELGSGPNVEKSRTCVRHEARSIEEVYS